MEEEAITQNELHDSIANLLKSNQHELIELSFEVEAEPPPPSEQAKHEIKEYLCPRCGEKKFSNISGLNQHLKGVHKIPMHNITNIKCMDCAEFKCFPTIRTLRVHLMRYHGYKMDEERHVFPSMYEFFSWKKNMEAETSSFYTKQSGPGRLKKCRIHFFMCHRSGVTSSSGAGKKKLKSQGSCKLGFFCTSTVTAREMGNKVMVNYVKQHYKHPNDVTHLRLTHEEKFEIASKLLDGVPYDNILKEFHNKEGNLKKSHMLKRKDIYNVKKRIESVINKELKKTQSKNLCAGDSPVVVDGPSQDNMDHTPESLPTVQLSDRASDENPQPPIQTNAELCIDKALEKLKLLCNTLSDNKKEFCEEVSQEILKRVDQLVEISRSKTLPSETPVTRLPYETPVTRLPYETPVTRLPYETPVTRLLYGTPVTQLQTMQLVTVQQPQTLCFVQPPTYQKSHFVITNSPVSKSNGTVVKKLLPLRPKTTNN